MDNVELVIKLPDNIKKQVDAGEAAELNIPLWLAYSIQNGTPLPKGHGDLIDVNRRITVPIYDPEFDEYSEKTLTVREALNRWSDEGVTVADVVILADKESEDKE